ncbi:MAG: hypothetical protein AAF610_10915 [Pseudomonadota bacterium]
MTAHHAAALIARDRNRLLLAAGCAPLLPAATNLGTAGLTALAYIATVLVGAGVSRVMPRSVEDRTTTIVVMLSIGLLVGALLQGLYATSYALAIKLEITWSLLIVNPLPYAVSMRVGAGQHDRAPTVWSGAIVPAIVLLTVAGIAFGLDWLGVQSTQPAVLFFSAGLALAVLYAVADRR